MGTLSAGTAGGEEPAHSGVLLGFGDGATLPVLRGLVDTWGGPGGLGARWTPLDLRVSSSERALWPSGVTCVAGSWTRQGALCSMLADRWLGYADSVVPRTGACWGLGLVSGGLLPAWCPSDFASVGDPNHSAPWLAGVARWGSAGPWKGRGERPMSRLRVGGPDGGCGREARWTEALCCLLIPATDPHGRPPDPVSGAEVGGGQEGCTVGGVVGGGQRGSGLGGGNEGAPG